jgi:hypothetical protein
MGFTRVQTQQHKLESVLLDVSYDRFTTKFELKENGSLVYSSFLALLPIRRSELLINGKPYTLKIFWLLLWQSKLQNENGLVIPELLYLRRKRSIGLLIYAAFITSAKIAIGFMSQT